MAIKTQYQVALVNTPASTSGVNQSSMVFSNNTTSTALYTGGTTPVGLIIPTGFLACNLSFKVTKDNVNYFTLTNFDATAFTIAAGNGPYWLPLQPVMFCGVVGIQLVSSVTQSGSPVVDCAMAPIFQGIHG